MPHSVLCVDDDRNLCQIIAKALEGEGYRVLKAHDGDAGLAAFDAETPDLVLMDLLLPGKDGFEVVEGIRSRANPACETPVFLISGCSKTPAYEERAAGLRVDAFLTKPVPLDQLLEQVAKALPAASRAPEEKLSRPLILEGALDELPFPALLHQLHGLRASGALLLRSGKKRKAIQLRDGRPVGVRSNQVSECLGNLLVRMGRIDGPTLKETLRRMKGGEGLQGEVLVAMEVLSEAEIANALRVQAEEKLFEIFEWTSGTFEFRRGGRLKGASTLGLDGNPASIIVSGVTSRFPIEKIDSELRGHSGKTVVAAGESPFYLFQDLTLDAPAQCVLQRVTEGASMDDLLDAGETSQRILYALLAAQVVELRDAGEPAADPGVTANAVAAARARLASVRRDPEEEAVREELTAMAQRVRGANLFEVLDVAQDAEDEDVRAAYVDLAKRTHPDRFSAFGDAIRRLAEEVFGRVSLAHETLTDRRGRDGYRLQLAQGARLEEEMDEARRALAAEEEFQKGAAALKSRRYHPAFEAFKSAVELYPHEGEYLAYLGWTRFLSAQRDESAQKEAVKALRKAAKLAPDSEKPYLFLGQLLKATGRHEPAERMFVKAVQVKSDCVEALRELRLINLRREKQKGLVRRLLRR
jgi:CheY-like chemotaxis protein/tetratricopeptide (TPR) repeat protein